MMRAPFVLAATVALSTLAFAGPAGAAAVRNGPTTRDCSLLFGIDPDFVQLSGVDVTQSGQLVAAGSSVHVLASESADKMDQKQRARLSVTVTGPNGTQMVSGLSVGHVTLDVSLPRTGTYTISWKATFDNGAHPCPGLLTPMNIQPKPFVVLVP